MSTVEKPPLSEEAKQKRREAAAKGRAMAAIRRAERKARGETVLQIGPIERSRRDPTSRAKALVAYFWDLHGIEPNSGSGDSCDGKNIDDDRKQARADARKVVAIAEGSRRKAIRNICLDCVGQMNSVNPLTGDENPGGDYGGYERVRECTCSDCPLHKVRPRWGQKGDEADPEPDAGAEPSPASA